MLLVSVVNYILGGNVTALNHWAMVGGSLAEEDGLKLVLGGLKLAFEQAALGCVLEEVGNGNHNCKINHLIVLGFDVMWVHNV